MFGSDLYTLLEHVPNFAGVYASDKIPSYTKNKIYVVNTNKSYQKGWGHWVVLDFTIPGGYMLDSFGNSPSYYGLNTMKYSTKTLQSDVSVTCGIYATYYVLFRAHNFTPTQILSHFSGNKKENDDKIIKWMKELGSQDILHSIQSPRYKR